MPCPSSDTPTSLTTTLAPSRAEAQRELAADAASRTGDDRDPPVEQPHGQLPTAAVAAPATDCDAVLVRDREVDVDEVLAVLLALAGDDRGAREHVAGPHLLREAHLQPADRLGAEPVLDDPGREAHREHAVAEHRRVPDLGRDRVVVVHRVEVARRARVRTNIVRVSAGNSSVRWSPTCTLAYVTSVALTSLPIVRAGRSPT